jgi:YfiH family protein
MNNSTGDWIIPDWPAPANVQAYTTTRLGGVSRAPYAGFNLGDHVSDIVDDVTVNRAQLKRRLNLPAAPVWLNQVHGTQIVNAAEVAAGCTADGSYTTQAGVVCAVLTADCLPVLLCNREGSKVAAAHAGWRGLANGVIETTLAALDSPPENLMAWLGPAIGPQAFEVGAEVREIFMAHHPQAVDAFKPTVQGCTSAAGAGCAGATAPSGRWLADIYLLARQRLARQGVTAVYGGGECTYTDAQRFYSFRRDRITGRMASLIWLVK